MHELIRSHDNVVLLKYKNRQDRLDITIIQNYLKDFLAELSIRNINQNKQRKKLSNRTIRQNSQVKLSDGTNTFYIGHKTFFLFVLLSVMLWGTPLDFETVDGILLVQDCVPKIAFPIPLPPVINKKYFFYNLLLLILLPLYMFHSDILASLNFNKNKIGLENNHSLFWQFSNIIIYVKIVGKIPDQHLSVWLFSNPGDKVHILVETTGQICPIVLHLF